MDADAGHSKRKIVAFVGGLDLCMGRYDTPEHSIFRSMKTLHKDDCRNPTFSVTIVLIFYFVVGYSVSVHLKCVLFLFRLSSLTTVTVIIVARKCYDWQNIQASKQFPGLNAKCNM